MLVASALFFFLVSGICLGDSFTSGKCTVVGRFPNDDVESMPDCRGFSICTQGAGGVIFQHDGMCPLNFIYSHVDQECTNATNYKCRPEYQCQDEGKFINHGSQCSSYIECVKGFTDTVTARLIVCPTDTIYNELEAACVDASKYECNRGVRTHFQFVPILLSMLYLITL